MSMPNSNENKDSLCKYRTHTHTHYSHATRSQLMDSLFVLRGRSSKKARRNDTSLIIVATNDSWILHAVLERAKIGNDFNDFISYRSFTDLHLVSKHDIMWAWVTVLFCSMIPLIIVENDT